MVSLLRLARFAARAFATVIFILVAIGAIDAGTHDPLTQAQWVGWAWALFVGSFLVTEDELSQL